MLDLFLSLMVFNLNGHFKILLNILETFPRPEGVINCNGLYSQSEQAEVAKKLKECIVYHRTIAE